MNNTNTTLTVKPLPPDSATSTVHEDHFIKRVFLTPAVALLLIFSIFPLFWSLGISFTTYERGADSFSLTLENYTRMFADEQLGFAIRNTLIYVVAGVTIQYLIGFGLALLLNQEFFGRRFFRVVFLLPMMVTPIVTAYTGRMMFDTNMSPLAQLLRTIGTFLTNLTGQTVNLSVPWMTDGSVAPFTIVLIDSWQWIPFMTLLLLAGMQAIPDEIYEAAHVDGANNWEIFSKITFPIMLPITITAVLIRGLEIFKIVDIIRVTTGGGPGSATQSLVMYVSKIVLDFGNYSYAAAISYVLMVMVVVFSTIFLSIGRRVTFEKTGL